MAEDNNDLVNSVADDEARKKEKNKGKGGKINANAMQNIIKFVASHIVVIGYIAMGLLILIFIIGILQILITMPGVILGKIKQIVTTLFGQIAEQFNGDSVSYLVLEEDEVELAEYVKSMGYTIEGYGFGEVEYEEVAEKDKEGNEIEGKTTNVITKVNDGEEGKGVRGYIRSYLVSTTATYVPAVWSYGGFFSSLFTDEEAQDKSKGMIHIKWDGKDIDNGLLRDGLFSEAKFKILPEKKSLRVNAGGTYYYFNMSDWSSKYGKPMELFLALHLSTMMPDLTYELATSDAFNTKVTIDFQTVKRTYKVDYTTQDGHTYDQYDILRAYIQMVKGAPPSSTEEGLYDEAKSAMNNYTLEPKQWEVPPIFDELDPENDDDDKHGREYKINSLINFVLNGNNEAEILWPRITDVKKHWYYNTIKFEYGRAKYAKKDIIFDPEDDYNPLRGLSIVMKTTMTSEKGFFYQLEEPERDGPNDAIIALFKGGKGNIGDASYDFPGKYYRYDGTYERAQEINNARAVENKGSQYLFMGKTYPTHPALVYKEPVVFYDADNKNSYKNAFTAFAMLEKSYSEEAEVSYRCLKELMVKLNYFTEDEMKDPVTQVLKWILPDNTRRVNIGKNPNLYGLSIIGNESSDRIIAPGDGKVIDIDDNTLTMEFGKLNPGIVSILKKKYHIDEADNEDIQLYYIDEDAIVGLQMVIVGITPTVREEQQVTVDTYLGTPVDGDGSVQVYFKYADGSIVDNVETYMDVYGKNFKKNEEE